VAKKVQTITTLTDDLDGGKADQTVTFSFDGTSYEIGLSKKNATTFNKLIKPYVESARRVRATRGTSSTAIRGKGRGPSDLAEIREWANANGHSVAGRGRISADVVAAYDAR
jgi:hypothetical protein